MGYRARDSCESSAPCCLNPELFVHQNTILKRGTALKKREAGEKKGRKRLVHRGSCVIRRWPRGWAGRGQGQQAEPGGDADTTVPSLEMEVPHFHNSEMIGTLACCHYSLFIRMSRLSFELNVANLLLVPTKNESGFHSSMVRRQCIIAINK